MEFQEESVSGFQIQAVNEQSIRIEGELYTESLLITAQAVETCGEVEQLSQIASVYDRIQAIAPEVVLIGCGRQPIHPEAEFYQFFIENRLGVEVMTTSAAARTYNILQSEGRRVLAVLILTLGDDKAIG